GTDSSSGSTHTGKTLDESLDYIDLVAADYLIYSGLPAEALRGRRVLEVGPGDNLGVAMKLLVAGASQVVSLDRFYSHRNPQQQEQIYRGLRGRLSEDEGQGFEPFVEVEGGGWIGSRRPPSLPP